MWNTLETFLNLIVMYFLITWTPFCTCCNNSFFWGKNYNTQIFLSGINHCIACSRKGVLPCQCPSYNTGRCIYFHPSCRTARVQRMWWIGSQKGRGWRCTLFTMKISCAWPVNPFSSVCLLTRRKKISRHVCGHLALVSRFQFKVTALDCNYPPRPSVLRCSEVRSALCMLGSSKYKNWN